MNTAVFDPRFSSAVAVGVASLPPLTVTVETSTERQSLVVKSTTRGNRRYEVVTYRQHQTNKGKSRVWKAVDRYGTYTEEEGRKLNFGFGSYHLKPVHQSTPLPAGAASIADLPKLR